MYFTVIFYEVLVLIALQNIIMNLHQVFTRFWFYYTNYSLFLDFQHYLILKIP